MISLFQSTRIPRGGATATTSRLFPTFAISIHAPHEGCDRALGQINKATRDFNPCTPRGVRQPSWLCFRPYPYFNPRTPRGGATSFRCLFFSVWYFNPRTPRGGATSTKKPFWPEITFQSTHPTRGCDAIST